MKKFTAYVCAFFLLSIVITYFLSGCMGDRTVKGQVIAMEKKTQTFTGLKVTIFTLMAENGEFHYLGLAGQSWGLKVGDRIEVLYDYMDMLATEIDQDGNRRKFWRVKSFKNVE